MQANQNLANKKDQLAELFRQKGLVIKPISNIQSNIWFQSHLNEDLNIAYNLRRGFLVSGTLDVNKLRASIEQMILQHAALRTIFMKVNGAPIKLSQIHHQPFELAVEPIPVAINDLAVHLQHVADVPFNFGQENLFRFKLYQVSEDQYAFLMVVHHIICDGYAMDLMLKAISDGYETPTSSISIPSKQEVAPTISANQSLDYWKDSLQRFPKLHNLPLDHSRPAELSYLGAKVTQTFDRKLSDKLHAYCQESNLTPFVALLSVWSILLSKMSAEQQLVIGFPLSTRDEATNNDIDLLVDTLPLGISISSDTSFSSHAKSVRKRFFEAYENRHVSFYELSEQLNLERNLSYHPVYQLAFTFLENKQQLYLDGIQTEEFPISKSRIKMDLEWHIELDHEKNFRCNVHYNTSLFHSATIDQYIDRFMALSASCFDQPDQLISQLSIISQQESEQLLQFATGKSLPVSKIPVHKVFEEIVPKVEDKAAIVFIDQQFTYSELNRKSNQFAHYLLKVAPEENFVGLFLSPGPETIIGMLGAMKAGKAYVPIDPAYPEKRVNHILDDSGITTLLTSGTRKHFNDKTLITLSDCVDYPESNPSEEITVEDLIYMIYTSGTTGLPKGVPIQHQGILNYTWSKIDQQAITSEDVALQLMSFSFDGFGCEAFPTLLLGGTLILTDKLSDTDLDALGNVIETHGVTRFMAVPSTLKLILGHLQSEDLKEVKTISLGGEKPDSELLEKLSGINPELRLFNEYGPTENSIASTSGSLDKDSTGNIGQPLANGIAVILDDSGQLVPAGVSGELCVGGPGLTSGYFEKPNLTSEKFFSSKLFPGQQLYRTGDRAQWDSNGHVHFMGRSDDQVKVNGVRIELEEIRQTLLDHPVIKDCVIVNKEATLEAIIQAHEQNHVINPEDLSSFLSEQLPHYMIPASYRIATHFPVTAHGKIDMDQLKMDSKPLIQTATNLGEVDSEMADQLKMLWGKVLQIDPSSIDIKNNFFDLGGHSLLLGKLVTVINKETDLNLDKVDFFKYPTIHALVRAKSSNEHAKTEQESAPPSRAEIRKSQRNKRLKRQH